MLPIRKVTPEQYRQRLRQIAAINVATCVLLIALAIWGFAIGKTRGAVVLLVFLVVDLALVAAGIAYGRRKGRI